MNAIVVDNPPYEVADLILKTEANFTSGLKEFQSNYNDITTLEEDLLRVSASIFCTDLSYKRREREEFIRDISLKIPVVNFHAFERVKDKIEYALYCLSNDNWTIEFVQKAGAPETKIDFKTEEGATLLFSGGLDSLSAAVEYLSKGHKIHLVSHITRNPTTKKGQEDLYSELKKLYGTNVSRDYYYVSGYTKKDFPFPSDQHREESQRTRSFLFLSLAALGTRRKGFNKILMIAENGQMAIHLPITSARIGSFSTHTAHPEYVFIMQQILSTLLNFELEIQNPYLYKTKAQVVEYIVNNYPNLVEKSVSCWRGSRISGKDHCGECVPCLVRRISLEYNNLHIAEYGRDILNEEILTVPEDDNGKRNLMDLLEFIYRFSQDQTESAIIENFPEIVNEHISIDDAIKMYKLFSQEAIAVFSKYPNIQGVLK